MVAPVIADRNGKRFLLAREQETGKLRAHGVPAEPIRAVSSRSTDRKSVV